MEEYPMPKTVLVVQDEIVQDDASPLFSAKEAARRLGISRATLSRLIAARKIGVYRTGVKTLFNQRILEEYKAQTFHPLKSNCPRAAHECEG
jgi:excisionase family DNA binding protein